MRNLAPRVLPWLLPCCLTLVVFGQSWSFEFVSWDDPIHVTRNPLLQPVSAENLRKMWSEPYKGLYIPVSYTLLACEVLGSGSTSTANADRIIAATWFHVTAVLLHVTSTGLIFAILYRILGDRWAASFGALLFGIHPLQAESAAWVSETRGLACGLFSWASIWFFLASLETKTESGETPRREGTSLPRWGRYLVASACLVLALLSKPTAVVVPLMALLLQVGVAGGSARGGLLASVPWLAISFGIACLNKHEQPNSSLDYLPHVSHRAWIGADALGWHLRHFFWPVGLGIDYGRTPISVVTAGLESRYWLLPLLVLLVLGMLPCRRRWLIAYGLALVALLPTLGLVPFQFQDISSVADRYFYLAMLGPAFGLASWLAAKPRPWRFAVAALGCAPLAALGFQQAASWRNDGTLYERALQVNPRSWIAHNNFGTWLFDQGELEKSIAQYQSAILIKPNYAIAHLNLGKATAALGRLDESIRHYRAGLKLEPDHPEVRLHLGNLLLQAGRSEEAREQYEQLSRANPNLAEAHYNLGNILAEEREYLAAEGQFRQAIRCREDYAEAHNNLGGVLAIQGRVLAARSEFARAARLRPDYLDAHLNLVNLLIDQGLLARAREHLQKSLELLPSTSSAARELERRLNGLK